MGLTKGLLVRSTEGKNKDVFFPFCLSRWEHLSSQQVFSSYVGGVSGPVLTLRCIFIPLQEADSWVIIEGLKIGQSNVQRPDKHEGFMLKKRKWPLKGWHKVRATGKSQESFSCWKNTLKQSSSWNIKQFAFQKCAWKKFPFSCILLPPLWASSAITVSQNTWKLVPVVAIFRLTEHTGTMSCSQLWDNKNDDIIRLWWSIVSVCPSCYIANTLCLCLLSLQRFFVLDNGILKYSKSPIDVSNPDYNSQAGT